MKCINKMCGLCGFVDTKNRLAKSEWDTVLTKMSQTLNHRGPDSFGNWIDHDRKIAFSHRRLAILDLSEAGHQPMHSKSDRFCIVFNGEIYNHKLLRNKFKDTNWIGHSDTETILCSIEKLGIEQSLKEFRGMFSFAIIDKEKNQLTLARDRFGEKPLYYGINEGILFFASELKSLISHPYFKKELNNNALYHYAKYSFIPDPLSIYEGISKLPAGSYLTISLNNISDLPAPIQYWNTESEYLEAIANPLKNSENEVIELLEHQLKKTVKMYSISDVPIGTFLSGGIDSSLVTAILQNVSNTQVNTYTMGFGEKNHNEAPFAKEVSSHLETNHTEAFVSANDAISLVPHLINIYDEPFADASQIPTLLLAKLTSKKIRVCLTGDGGDELFCGYSRYLWGKHILEMNPLIKGAIKNTLPLLTPGTINSTYNILSRFFTFLPQISLLGDKLFKIKDMLSLEGSVNVHDYFLSSSYETDKILNLKYFSDIFPPPLTKASQLNFLDYSMLSDIKNYLTSDILVKVDRASMKYSLETRVPFLDSELARLAWRVPLSYKIKNKESKWILKKLLSKYVPHNLVDRPKMGFGVPIDSWLRGPLKSWSKEILFSSNNKLPEYVNMNELKILWEQHQDKSRNWQAKLWNILILKSWLKNI